MPMRQLSILREAEEHIAHCKKRGEYVSIDLIRRLAAVIRAKNERIKQLNSEIIGYRGRKKKVPS